MNILSALVALSTLPLVLSPGLGLPTMAATESPTSLAANIEAIASTLQPGSNRVTFQSEGETLVGTLYLPATYQAGDALPAVVVAGAWITVKEQMASLYAQKLSEQGFAALAFDFRYYGESGGTPRQLESPAAKVQDIKNAITYLESLPMVDSDRISGLGICFGAGYMAQVAAEDPRLNAFATVAAWMHDAESLDQLFGSEVIDQRMQAGLAAQRRYAETGIVDRVPAFTTAADPIAAMTGEPIYYGNPTRGSIPAWRNDYAVMSWVEWIQFDALAVAPQVHTPALFVHSDGSALPENVRRFYNAMPGPKQLIWTEGNHFDFYDQEPAVNTAVAAIADYFQTVPSSSR
ncbi:alpha/beta hydrolase [filamentous cyanobacterium CCT1]|nr:alpha/beta hydrolase [filamentous cyanobacterium CCT1]PSN81132.1 alpha/beta hydrolase [filamentous cyanobacterium CCP4]